MLASIDGFVERIDNAHFADTIQSFWVLWGRISLCFLQKIRTWDSISTDIEVNAFMPGRKYVFVATLQEQSLLFCWILSFWTLQQRFFDYLQKLSEICVRFPFCLIACFWVGINIFEEWYRLSFLEFVAYTRFLCFVYINYSSCFGRNILKDPRFQISTLADCGTL